jgi:hypothetical protein
LQRPVEDGLADGRVHLSLQRHPRAPVERDHERRGPGSWYRSPAGGSRRLGLKHYAIFGYFSISWSHVSWKHVF